MRQDEAMEQVAYVKRLVDETRFRVSVGYPLFLMWGLIWVIGYLGLLIVPDGFQDWVWPPLFVIAFLGHVLDARSQRYRVNPPTQLTRKLFQSNLLLAAATFLLPALLGLERAAGGSASEAVRHEHFVSIGFSTFYIPFMIGVIYMINGLFVGIELVRIGAWLSVAAFLGAVIANAMGQPAALAWMAVAGGGSLLLTGVILRNRWRAESVLATTAAA